MFDEPRLATGAALLRHHVCRARTVARKADMVGHVDLRPRSADQHRQMLVIIIVEHLRARHAVNLIVARIFPMPCPLAQRMAHRPDMLGRTRRHVADAEMLEHAERDGGAERSEEHTSELQSLMRISYAVFCLKT